MSENMNCPCCGAIPGQAHDDDCKVAAYLLASVMPGVYVTTGLDVAGERMSTTLPDHVEKRMDAPMLLDAAAGHMRDRAATYDQPGGERSMGRTVEAFNVITGRKGDTAITESEGWLLMQILKDVRDRQREAPHRDSLEDGIAYAALKAEARLVE